MPLSYYVWWIVGLGVAGGIAGYISRLFLFETAYNFEYDLRNIIYEHLTKMSFAFYDRVQSGQLISAGQLGHPFGPDVYDLRPAHPGPMLHRHRRLRVHAVDQRAIGLRGHGHHALRLLRRGEDAPVHVPRVVDHPGPSGRGGHGGRRERQWGPGGQVLRRRGAAAPEPLPSHRPGAVGLYQRRRHPGPIHPRRPEPTPGGSGPGAAVRRVHGDPRPAWASVPSWPSTPTS